MVHTQILNIIWIYNLNCLEKIVLHLFVKDYVVKYMENPTKKRHENIRVYPNVRFIRTYVSNNKVGHLVDVLRHERLNNGTLDTRRYDYSKQLMFGSLLLFTNDNFETILCATVLDSSYSLLCQGYLAVSFQNPVSKNIFSESYLMVESEIFFEPYHRVLKVLQDSRIDDLPMKKYIVDVQPQTSPPSYLTNETIYTVVNSDNEDIPVPVLDVDQWPVPYNFDTSQFEAFKFALTREFAVVQGPPGTGKTFLGIKIATTLLKNLSLEGTPLLIICYTNHALDQFLEGLLDVTSSIVRLGSQCKSKLLEAYSLHSARMRIKSKYGYLYATKRTELEKIYKEMIDLQGEIEKCENEIVCYKNLKSYLKIEDLVLELLPTKEDAILHWLFNDVEEDLSEKVIEDDWETMIDEKSETIDTCFSEKWALKEIDSMVNSIKYVKDITEDDLEVKKMTEKFELQITKVKKRLDCFKKYKTLFSCSKSNMKRMYVPNVDDPYSLSTEHRWKLYYDAMERLKDDLTTKMNVLLEKHKRSGEELDEVSNLTDGEVMRSVRVVGVTTTTAARRHDLMKRLHSPIVIVEEAAEVLEAHIVASLTNRCQHLILIGDHKQLRPTAAHYRLAKHYNLEISLFERMVKNKIHSRTLSTQRRMRSQFVELLVPIVYEKLDSHPIVYGYDGVRGVVDNLWFYTHDVYEDGDERNDSWSHKNAFEAKWCVAFANYLRHNNYKADEITLLSTYNGQVTLLKEQSKKYEYLRDVKITAVDNFQGEESRIVILSLVRSNRDGNIGFLTASNRICVALSRAKEGFYIFGNMNVLKSASPIWKFINDKLIGMNAIGRYIRLKCDKHPDVSIKVDSYDSFDSCLAGKCLKKCTVK